MILAGTYSDVTENALVVPINSEENTVIFSVPVAVKPTDFVLVLAQAEVTNPYQFNVGLGRYLCRARSATGKAEQLIIPANMDNVTPDIHHKQVVLWGSDSGAEGVVYYQMVLYAVRLERKTKIDWKRDNLIVEQNYGKLIVMKFSQED